MSYTTVSLDQVAQIESGSVFPNALQGEEVGDLPFAKVSDISRAVVSGSRFISTAANYVSSETSKDLRARPFPPHSIVFAKIGEAIRGNRRAITTRTMLFDNNVMGVTPSVDLIERDYLYFFLQTKDFFEFANTTAVPSLRKSDLAQLQIPLPPLPEQRRIAAILDAADALRQKRRQALRLLDQLSQSIFIEMFGDPVTNPKGWPKKPLATLCDIEGSLVDPTLPEFSGLPHYGPDRIERDTGRLLPAKSAREDGVESGKFHFDENCILYSKIRPYLNKVALAGGDGVCSADVYPVRTRASAIDREFLWTLLRSGDFLKFADGFSNRANIPKLNREQFMAYPAMVPPSQLQAKFSTARKQIFALERTSRASQEAVERIFKSLQHRAFRGEL